MKRFYDIFKKRFDMQTREIEMLGQQLNDIFGEGDLISNHDKIVKAADAYDGKQLWEMVSKSILWRKVVTATLKEGLGEDLEWEFAPQIVDVLAKAMLNSERPEQIFEDIDNYGTYNCGIPELCGVNWMHNFYKRYFETLDNCFDDIDGETVRDKSRPRYMEVVRIVFEWMARLIYINLFEMLPDENDK